MSCSYAYCIALTFLQTIASSYRLLAQSVIDLEKCVMLLTIESSVKDLPGAVSFHLLDRDVVSKRVGEVEFDNVSFSYSSADCAGTENGLRNVSFKVAPGSTVALVGASGVGKR